MSTYPGENTGLPKNLLEAISNVPLNHLVPKDGISAMIDSSVVASLDRHCDAFSNIASGDAVTAAANSTNLSFAKSEESDELIFRKPKVTISKAKEARPAGTLLEGLSPLALKCLQSSLCDVKNDDIRKYTVKKDPRSKKHELSEDTSLIGVSSLWSSPDLKIKKAKVESAITVNTSDLNDQCASTFMGLIINVSADRETQSFDTFENWFKLEDNSFILTETFLSKANTTLDTIISTSGSEKRIPVDALLNLLDVLVDSLRISSSQKIKNADESLLKTVSHSSCNLIIKTLLLNKDDKRLLKEKYVLEPLKFISDSFENLKEHSVDDEAKKSQIMLLYESIGLLPSLIEKRSLLDDSLITSFVYLFSTMLMCDEFDSSNDPQVQAYRDRIKSVSRSILVHLFLKVPNQREFIIGELLSNVEKLPVRRLQKRLRKLDTDVFVTEFTITVSMMLENLNSFESFKAWSYNNENANNALKKIYIDNHTYLECFANQIADNFFLKLCENPSKYRSSLENYVYDLLALLPLPNWSISQYLLSIMMKRLLSIFSLKKQYPANIETTCLQLLGSIGACIFEIKCETLSNQDNNLIKICNYPECLPQFLNAFRDCLQFVQVTSDRDSAMRFLWQQRLGTFLKLSEYTEEEEGSQVKSLIYEEIAKQSELMPKESSKKKMKDYGQIKSAYYSILNSLELLNLYEPYLKVVLCLLESEKIKIKSTAIKCLSMLANKEQKVLSSPMVKETIEKSLTNSSASVKDAILDLVSIGSSCVDFYKQININYDHESISVRKHVLRTNKMIYDRSNERNIRVYVASKILQRIEDEEDTIIEMAQHFFLDRWLLPVLEDQSLEKEDDISGEIISVMSGVANGAEKSSQCFEWLLNYFLLNKAMHSSKTYENNIKCLNKLTNILVQVIVEGHGKELEEEVQVKERKDCLNLLAKFSDTSASFITMDHIVALYPYLLSDRSSDIHYYILFVFKNTFKKLNNFKPKFLYNLETVLLSKLPRMSVREMDEAIPLIWLISNQRNDTSRITRACSSCFQHLSPYIKNANSCVEIKVEGKLQRLLYLATGFARFCDFSGKNEKPQFVSDEESVYAHVAKCLLVLSRQQIPHLIRRMAIKNLAQLCCAHPKLFNSKRILELLDQQFETGQMDVKLVLLESFYDFFSLEERKSMEKAGVYSSVSSSRALKAKLLKEKKSESINDGICSALVARFLKNILNICLDQDIRSSLVAVRLLKLILQHGYANPSHCIPTVIALVGSTNSYMCCVATEMLNELFERYETLVIGGVSQGINVALKYSKVLEKENFYINDKFLSSLKDIIGNSKRSSSRFWKVILKVLKTNCDKIVGAQHDLEIRDIIVFLASNFSRFPFTTQNDLLTFLKDIDFEAEQLRETITDEASEVGEIADYLRNSLVVQRSLEELRSYMVGLYGIKPDLVADSREDMDLKNKPLAKQSAFQQSYQSVLRRIFDEYSGKTIVLDDLFNVKDQDI